MNIQSLTLPLDSFLLAMGCEKIHEHRFSFEIFDWLRNKQASHVAPVTVMGRADFIHHITLHMPEVSARIDEDDFGILHLEMGAMKLATLDAIKRYELFTVRRHFMFISHLFEHANSELYDAILVSYVEGLFIGKDANAHIRSLLPANLGELLKKAEHRYAYMESQIIKY